MRAWWRRSSGPRIAALTVVRDEAAMLPRWVAHYGAQFGEDALVVVDDRSTDGSTDDLPCRVVRHGGFPDGQFERARMQLVSRLAEELLADHDAVLFSDADEFLVTDPDVYDGLQDAVARRPEVGVLAGVGFNVVHHVGVEGPLRAGEPVLGQRRFGKVATKLCKPALKRVPAPWVRASHGIRAPYAVDPGLLMVHLKFADQDLLRRTSELRNAVHASTGLTEQSSWAVSGDDLAGRLASFAAGADEAADYDARALDLDALVQVRGDAHEAAGRRQLVEMAEHPLLRLPDRFVGRV